MESIIDAPLDLTAYAKQLAAAGVQTVIRYYNNKNSATFPTKCLTAAELEALFDAGLSVAVVFQQRGGAGGNLDDLSEANGTRDGKRAAALAAQLGQPKGSAIYFAVDHDYVKTAELHQIGKYFAAARKELKGDFLMGVYGSGLIAAHLTKHGLVEHAWLAGATGWSGTKAELTAGRWSLFQKYLSKTSPIGGFGYDGNITNPERPNFGQFYAAAVIETPIGVGSAAIYEVTARSGLNLRGGPGENYKVLQTLPEGQLVTGIGLEGDWMKVDLEGDEQADGFMYTQYLRAVSGGVAPPPPTLPPSATAHAPIDFARQELALGVKEIPGSGDNPRIVMYHATTGGGAAPDETAWCSSFVNYCVKQAGLVGTNSKWARSWHDSDWGTEVGGTPMVGDIVVFSRTGNGVNGGHVGFYLDEDTNTVLVLGGNQSNKVCQQRYPKNGNMGSMKYKVLSIRRG